MECFFKQKIRKDGFMAALHHRDPTTTTDEDFILNSQKEIYISSKQNNLKFDPQMVVFNSIIFIILIFLFKYFLLLDTAK